MSYKVGSAFLAVEPDLRNFHTKIAAKLKGMDDDFTRAGERAGAKFTSGFKDRFRAADMPKATVRAVADTRAAGVELDHLARDRTVHVDVKTKTSGGSLLGKLGLGSLGGGGEGGASAGLEFLGPLANPYTLGTAIAALPFIAQIAGQGIVAGLGGALTGMAVLGAAKTKAVQSSFASLKTSATSDLVKIGASFVPVLTGLAGTAKSVLGEMTPTFKAAAGVIAGPFKELGDTFLKSFAQPEVKTSIMAVGNAFSSLLRAVTPQIPNDFRMIANAVTALSNTVAENPQAFSGFINFLVKAGVYGLNTVNFLAKAANVTERDFVPAMLGAGKAFLTGGQFITDGAHAIADAALTAFKDIVHGAADAFGWVPGIGGKLRSADAAIGNWKRSVDASFNGANQTLDRWKRNLSTMQTKVTLRGNIQDLTNKLNTAKNELKDPNLTKTRRAAIEANISQLVRQIAAARRQLNSLNGRTVSLSAIVGVHLVLPSGVPLTTQQKIQLGFQGYARGTAAAPAGWAWVGERGRELVRFHGGEQVLSHSASMAAMRQLAAMRTPQLTLSGGLPGAGRPVAAGPLALTVRYVGPSAGAIGAIVKDLRYEIQDKSGGDVQAHLGRGKARS